MSLNKTNKLESPSQTSTQINFSREGKAHAEKLSQSIQSAPLTVNILELAWTAGPVTFIALQVGHYFGFGKFAPVANVIYFATFTLMAGVLGLGAKIIHSFFVRPKVKNLKANYLRVIDQLVNAYLYSRDLKLEKADDNDKKFLASEMLLENIFITPSSLKSVMNDITQNNQLAREAKKIIIYRRAGLHLYANMLLSKTKLDYQDELNALKENHPNLYELIKKHLYGKTATIKEGLDRTKGFIERVLSASRNNSPELLSIDDIQAMIVLTLELLYGRQFSYFSFNFRGKKPLVATFKLLEKTRHELRLAISRFYNRFNALTNLINSEEELNLQQQNKQYFQNILQHHIQIINKKIASLDAFFNSRSLNQLQRYRLNSLLKSLNQIISLYKRMHENYIEVQQKIKLLEKSSKKWNELCEQSGQSATQVQTHFFSRGLDLVEKNIVLDEDELYEITQKITACLDDNPFFSLILKKKAKCFSFQNAAELAMELGVILDESIDLSLPNIQNALEASTMIALNTMELDYSASYKLGLGVALVNEIEDNLSKAAEQMVKIMHNVYNVELDEDSISYLNEKYNASIDFIRSLQQKDKTEPSNITDYLSTQLPTIVPPPQKWEASLAKAGAVLKKYNDA